MSSASRWKAQSCPRSSRRSRSSRRATTRSSAPRSWRSPPSIRSPAACQEEPGACRLHRGVPQDRHHRGGPGAAEKKGFDTGILAVHPFTAGAQAAGLRRQFHRHGLRHGRHLRLPGHDQRDLDFARKYGRACCRWCCRPAMTPHLRDRRRGLSRRRHHDQFAVPGRAHHRRPRGDRRPVPKPAAVGARKVNYRLRDWLHLAPALLGLPDPRHPLRQGRHRPGARRGLPVKLPEDVTFDKPGNPLDHHPTWKHVDLPQVR